MQPTSFFIPANIASVTGLVPITGSDIPNQVLPCTPSGDPGDCFMKASFGGDFAVPFGGTIDEVAVYSKPLPPAEVRDNYCSDESDHANILERYRALLAVAPDPVTVPWIRDTLKKLFPGVPEDQIVAEIRREIGPGLLEESLPNATPSSSEADNESAGANVLPSVDEIRNMIATVTKAEELVPAHLQAVFAKEQEKIIAKIFDAMESQDFVITLNNCTRAIIYGWERVKTIYPYYQAFMNELGISESEIVDEESFRDSFTMQRYERIVAARLMPSKLATYNGKTDTGFRITSSRIESITPDCYIRLRGYETNYSPWTITLD